MNGFESYITCPFDGSHRILKSRIQRHLHKCRKNYPNMKVVCPFDVTHMLDPDEYQHHLSICTTSGNVKCYQHVLEPKKEVGTIPIEEACNLQTSTINEDWFGNNPTYNPLAASENKNVLRIPIAMSKSEKKKFKQHERERMLSLDKNNGNNSNDNHTSVQKILEHDKPLRIPKNIAKAVSCDQSTSTDSIISQHKVTSMEKSNDTLISENSLLDNNDPNTSGQDTILINTLDKEINSSLIERNSSQCEKQENTSNNKKNISMTYQNIKVEDNVSESETVKQYSDSSRKSNLQTNNYPQKLTKDYGLEYQKRFGLNSQKGILYQEPRKVSTGRGFVLACKSSSFNILPK